MTYSFLTVDFDVPMWSRRSFALSESRTFADLSNNVSLTRDSSMLAFPYHLPETIRSFNHPEALSIAEETPVTMALLSGGSIEEIEVIPKNHSSQVIYVQLFSHFS